MLNARHIIVINVLAVLELDQDKDFASRKCAGEQVEFCFEYAWLLKFSSVMIMVYIKHSTETINDNINSKTSVWGSPPSFW